MRKKHKIIIGTIGVTWILCFSICGYKNSSTAKTFSEKFKTLDIEAGALYSRYNRKGGRYNLNGRWVNVSGSLEDVNNTSGPFYESTIKICSPSPNVIDNGIRCVDCSLTHKQTQVAKKIYNKVELFIPVTLQGQIVASEDEIHVVGCKFK